MLSKSDVGTYSYAPPGSPLPHAVMSVSGSTISTTFSYDPNGNQTAGLGRTITWTSYNMPASITQGTQTVSFQHDVNHQRVKQISANGDTLYINAFGVTAELFGAGTAAARWTEYLMVGNVRAGMRVTDIAASTTSLRYFHTDHLGSIAVITNEAGAVVERLSYDAWGKRRHPNGADDPAGSITSQTSRGFTGHEELDSVALVHMNGRLYDALMGRMISADPTVPDPMNAQAWNRYSYVGNDPLAFTDPSGFSWLSNFFNSVGNFFSKIFSPAILRSIAQLALTVILTAAISIPIIGPIIAAAASAAIITGISGGNLSQMLRAGLIAGLTAGALQGLNAFIGDLPAAAQAARYLTNVAGSAAIGCLSAAASGGSCKSGALAAGVTAAASPLIGKMPAEGRLAASSIVGGLASVAGGGKFENGAVTGAFQYMFGPKAERDWRDANAAEIPRYRNAAVFFTELLVGAVEVQPAVAPTLSDVWRIPPALRGNFVEGVLAETEYRDWEHHPWRALIDFTKGEDQVSLKTVDTTGLTWMSKMQSHIRGLAGIDTGNGSLILDIRVQPGGVAAARPLVEYGAQLGVGVRISAFPR